MDTREARTRTRLLRGSLPAVACAMALALTACGGDDPETATDSPATSDLATQTASPSAPASPTKKTPDTSNWPTCKETWVSEKRLPSGYRGCVEGTKPVRAKQEFCESGQIIVTYAGRFYAVLGGPVNETPGLSRSAAYKQAVDACLA